MIFHPLSPLPMEKYPNEFQLKGHDCVLLTYRPRSFRIASGLWYMLGESTCDNYTLPTLSIINTMRCDVVFWFNSPSHIRFNQSRQK